MTIIRIIEATVVVAVAVIVAVSLAHDHEGDWVNPVTGEVFHIADTDDTHCVATSNRRRIAISHRMFGTTFRHGSVTGEYDRWRGRIEWPDETWVRRSAGRNHALSWIHIRNLVRHWTVVGNWSGSTTSGVPVYMQITPEFSVRLRNGTVTETVDSAPTADGGLRMVNRLNETFSFSWGGRGRGTLAINNTNIVMHRLDS